MRKKKLFKNAAELEEKLEKYFNSLNPSYLYDDDGSIIYDKSGCPVMSETKPATISSMAYYLGFSSKEEFMSLLKDKGLCDTVKKALLRAETHTELLLFDKTSSTGAKFILQTDFGRDNESAVPDNREDNSGVVILAEVKGDESY